MGDTLLAAAFVSYAGPFTLPFRKALVEEQWGPDLAARGITLTAGVQPMDLLASDAAKVSLPRCLFSELRPLLQTPSGNSQGRNSAASAPCCRAAAALLLSSRGCHGADSCEKGCVLCDRAHSRPHGGQLLRRHAFPSLMFPAIVRKHSSVYIRPLSGPKTSGNTQ